MEKFIIFHKLWFLEEAAGEGCRICLNCEPVRGVLEDFNFEGYLPGKRLLKWEEILLISVLPLLVFLD